MSNKKQSLPRFGTPEFKKFRDDKFKEILDRKPDNDINLAQPHIYGTQKEPFHRFTGFLTQKKNK